MDIINWFHFLMHVPPNPTLSAAACKNFHWLNNSASDLLTSQVGQNLKANEPRQRTANLKETPN